MPQLFLTFKTATLELPLPPTINGGYWAFKGHRRFLTKKAIEFRNTVYLAVKDCPVRFGPEPLEMTVILNFRDRRVADLSNRIKALEDSLVHAGLMDDDSQIKIQHIYAGPIVKDGKCTVKINVLPFRFDV